MSSKRYQKFCSILGCQPYSDADNFNDFFQKTKIKWYLATTMDEDHVRSLIGMSCEIFDWYVYY
jgi:hypothetical protein